MSGVNFLFNLCAFIYLLIYAYVCLRELVIRSFAIPLKNSC